MHSLGAVHFRVKARNSCVSVTVLPQNKSPTSKLSTKYNCDLRVFPLKCVKVRSFCSNLTVTTLQEHPRSAVFPSPDFIHIFRFGAVRGRPMKTHLVGIKNVQPRSPLLSTEFSILWTFPSANMKMKSRLYKSSESVSLHLRTAQKPFILKL